MDGVKNEEGEKSKGEKRAWGSFHKEFSELTIETIHFNNQNVLKQADGGQTRQYQVPGVGTDTKEGHDTGLKWT